MVYIVTICSYYITYDTLFMYLNGGGSTISTDLEMSEKDLSST